MRWLSLATVVAVSIGVIDAASAADMAVNAPMREAPAVSSWTGFYIGGNVGGGWSDRDVTIAPNDPAAVTLFFPAKPPSLSFRQSGVLGGLQLGYNWQIQSNWLLGLETDFDFSGVKGDGSAIGLGRGQFPIAVNAAEKVTWFGTVRGRLGYVPTANLLIYGTGGFAYGRVSESVSFVNVSNAGLIFGGNPGFTCVPGTCFTGNSTRVATGWTAGGGFEYALANHWSLRAEYLFVDLGSNSLIATATAPGNPGQTLSTFTASFDGGFHVVRAGLNYRF